VTHAAPGQALEVWGCARPAPNAYLDTHRPQHVLIQLRPNSSQQFRTIKTVRPSAGGGCYFDVPARFPESGTVRLQWSYPRDDARLLDPATPGQTAIYSREVPITIQ
jgi:hypothetical protein